MRGMIFLFLMLSCRQYEGSDAEVGVMPEVGAVGLSADTNKKDQAKKPLIDPRTLFVAKLNLSNFHSQGVPAEMLNVELDGRASYLFYKICRLEVNNCNDEGILCEEEIAKCEENITSLNRVILPPLVGGKILLSVKACVDKAQSSNPSENCGSVREELVDSRRYDEATEKLLEQKAYLLASLKGVESDYRFALSEYVREARACGEHDAEVEKILNAKIKFISTFLEAPIGWMYDGLRATISNVLYGVGLESLDIAAKDAYATFKDKIKEAARNVCDKMSESSCLSVTMSLDTLKGFAVGFNPVHSIGTLSEAVWNLTVDPDVLNKKGCHAEENLRTRQNALEQVFSSRKQNLMEIENSLSGK